MAAAAGDPRETAYRKHKILYYAVEPFADSEMADILAAAFQVHETPPAERQKGPSEPISGISITNRNGHRVQLLAAPGLLWRNEGLGLQIGQKLLAQMLPVVDDAGRGESQPGQHPQDGRGSRSVMVLLAKDSGLLPGSLARDTKPDFGVDPGDAAGKITTLGGAARCDGRLGGPGCPDHGRPGRPHRAGNGGVLSSAGSDQQTVVVALIS